MSDYANDNTFSGWGEQDDWRLADQAEHDRSDVAHESFLDRRDRDLEMRRVMAMCVACKETAALPTGNFCAACEVDVLAGLDAA